MQPYQYSLGGVVFGRNTNIPISKIDIQPYNVNVQDAQTPMSDEVRFGIDSLTPGPIVFTMAVLENHILPEFSNLVPENFDPDNLFAMRGTVLARLAKTWKARELRAFWGAVIPLLHMTGDGEVLRIYGRPGKFQYAPRTNDRTGHIDVQAEFRRGDTYAHSDIEYFIGDPVDPAKGLKPNTSSVTAERGPGDADSWIRVLLKGPAVHPVVAYGGKTIELDLTIAAGNMVEVSSYPWQRRIVDNLGVNHRAKMVGETNYLEDIQFPAEEELEVSWTCTGSDANTEMYFMWREAYNVI